MTSSPTWTPDQPIIRCRDVHKSFGSLQVLKGISLELMKGDVVCVIGPSGSGKSTFIRCINALTPMDGGSITVEGQEVNDPKLDKLTLRRKVGMVFQQYNRSEEHTSEIQSLMRISYAVFCLKKKKTSRNQRYNSTP